MYNVGVEKVNVMTALEQVEKLLPTMSSAERAKVALWVAQDLAGVYPGIESTPDVCGGDPCISGTRISVWILENWRRMGLNDSEILQHHPTLRADDLVQAWAYIRTHQQEISEQIKANEEA